MIRGRAILSTITKRMRVAGVPTPSMFVGDEIILNTIDHIAYVKNSLGEVEILNQFLIASDITKQVGIGGDFSTLIEAIEWYSKFVPETDGQVILNLVSGYVMKEQVLVAGINLGFIKITSTDPIVTIDRASLTTEFSLNDYGLESYPAFGVKRGGALPSIDTNFIFNGTGFEVMKHGLVSIGSGSSADILDDKAMTNAPEFGLYASEGGAIHATGVDVSGAGGYGLNVKRGGIIMANFFTGTSNQKAKKVTSDGIIF